MTLNPHLGEFASLSLSEPPVWQVQDVGTSVDIQTGDGTPSIRFHPDGTVTVPQGLATSNLTGNLDSETTGGTIDADTVDGLDSTQFLRSDQDDTTTGNLTVGPTLSLAGPGATLALGEAGGPHSIAFGRAADATDGMTIHYRTTPELVTFENDAGTDLLAIPVDGTRPTIDGSDVVVASDALDAATLDGDDSTAFARKAENATIAGNWTHDGTLTTTDTLTANGALTANGTLTATGTVSADGTLRAPRVTSDPASPQTGTFWYNETDDVFRFRLASTTTQVPADGSTGGGGGGGGTTLLEGFEDGDMAGWEGLTGGYSVVTSPALEGTYTLSATTNFNQIANANIGTPRDGTYSCLVRAASDGGRPGMLTNVQSVPTGLFDNCYWVSINTVENRLYLTKRSGGTGTDLEMQTGVAVDPNVTYRLKLLMPTTSSIQARVEQTDGTLIAETAVYSDSAHTGGSLGIYPGGSGTQYYDAFRKE